MRICKTKLNKIKWENCGIHFISIVNLPLKKFADCMQLSWSQWSWLVVENKQWSLWRIGAIQADSYTNWNCKQRHQSKRCDRLHVLHESKTDTAKRMMSLCKGWSGQMKPNQVRTGVKWKKKFKWNYSNKFGRQFF